MLWVHTQSVCLSTSLSLCSGIIAPSSISIPREEEWILHELMLRTRLKVPLGVKRAYIRHPSATPWTACPTMFRVTSLYHSFVFRGTSTEHPSSQTSSHFLYVVDFHKTPCAPTGHPIYSTSSDLYHSFAFGISWMILVMCRHIWTAISSSYEERVVTTNIQCTFLRCIQQMHIKYSHAHPIFKSTWNLIRDAMAHCVTQSFSPPKILDVNKGVDLEQESDG